MNSCAGFQGVADDVEKMVDNDAIVVKVDKDSFQKDTDVDVEIHVTNKDKPTVSSSSAQEAVLLKK